MRQPFILGDVEIYWLEGGLFEIDGGSMFGVVPKVLWEKKCAATPDNYVTVADFAMLLKTPAANILIETGLGNKLTAKQQQIFRLRREWDIPAELERLGLSRQQIDHVILTHCDFDHAGGITMLDGQERLELTFPNALHHMQRDEWEDVCAPNSRAASSYWPINFEGLVPGANLQLADGDYQVAAGVEVFKTGGHTRGHQGVRLCSQGETALHLGDLLPTAAYSNPLWVTAYDNFPLDSVAAKEAILPGAFARKIWFLFYHEPRTLACRFGEDGEVSEEFSEVLLR
ncbi:MAG: MBL fold metallo-hydrolase [Desulfobulbaceae bacterium]|nr:MBL fold metallo-hydrolase [Desulfobulbaceae bacterium]HIJ79914.1 MBL fold metallo-hydrolase [Deltaproteobacteria bacterium]